MIKNISLYSKLAGDHVGEKIWHFFFVDFWE